MNGCIGLSHLYIDDFGLLDDHLSLSDRVIALPSDCGTPNLENDTIFVCSNLLRIVLYKKFNESDRADNFTLKPYF